MGPDNGEETEEPGSDDGFVVEELKSRWIQPFLMNLRFGSSVSRREFWIDLGFEY